MSNSLLDILAEKFSKQKDILEEDLGDHLCLFDMTDEYIDEIENKFKSKAELIFDMEKDANSFLDFVTKVYGKSSIASFHYIEFEDEKYPEENSSSEENSGNENNSGSEENEHLTSRQLVYLNGKLDLLNKKFDFGTNDLFTYGNYENMKKKEYRFTSFRSQNSNILIKVEEDRAYGIFTSHGNVDTIIGIRKDFFTNPIIEMYEGIRIEEDNGINEENVGKIFPTLNTKKGILKEFKIYQIKN